MKEESCLLDVLRRHEPEILDDWMKQYEAAGGTRDDAHARELLAELGRGLERSGSVDVHAPEWARTRELLTAFVAARGRRGAAPSAAAQLVFSLRYALFARLRADLDEARRVADEMWRATMLLDALCLFALDAWHGTGDAAAA